MIDIVIPHLKDRDLMPTLKSILNQGYKDINIIVQTDTMRDGAAVTRNKALKKCKSTYIFFCDDDIILRPDCLSSLYFALEDSGKDIAYCGFQKDFGHKKGAHIPVEWDFERLKGGNYISMVSMVRREKCPLMDESLEALEDWDLWWTMGENGSEGVYVDKILFTAKCDNDGISANCDYWKWDKIVKEKHQCS
jgi:glycosyltransferase involved in cell wall biosynthesis